MNNNSTDRTFGDTNPKSTNIIKKQNVTFTTSSWFAQAVGYAGQIYYRFYDLDPSKSVLSVKVFQKLGVSSGIDWYPIPYTQIGTDGTVIINYWVDILNTTVGSKQVTDVIINGYSKYNSPGYPAGAYQNNRFIIFIESTQIE